MKYRIEVQQVFTPEGYDRGGEWLALGDKPRGKAAAIALMETIQAASGLQPPYRVVAIDALGDRVEVARIESPHKPAPAYAVEVTDAQGEKRQEFDSLPLAMQMYSACVDGAENDPRKGYTRRVALVGIESGDTYYQWEYQAPQVAQVKAQTTAQEVMALVSQDKAAVTLSGGYAVDYAGNRATFEPGHVVSDKRNQDGRCTALVVSYKDNSVLSFTWSENAGARYQIKPSIKGSN